MTFWTKTTEERILSLLILACIIKSKNTHCVVKAIGEASVESIICGRVLAYRGSTFTKGVKFIAWLIISCLQLWNTWQLFIGFIKTVKRLSEFGIGASPELIMTHN